MKVSFLGPVQIGRRLECVARVIAGGKNTAFLEAELTDLGPVGAAAGVAGEGRPVAKASSTYLYGDRGGDDPHGDGDRDSTGV